MRYDTAQPETMAGLWDWLTGGYFHKTPEERAAVVLGKGSVDALAVFVQQDTDTNLAEAQEAAALILPVYREAVLVAKLPKFEIARGGENIDLVNYIQQKTGLDGETVTDVLVTLERRAKAGQIDRELWAPSIGGPIGAFFERLAEPGMNAAKGVAISAAIIGGIYVFSLVQLPRIRPLARGY